MSSEQQNQRPSLEAGLPIGNLDELRARFNELPTTGDTVKINPMELTGEDYRMFLEVKKFLDGEATEPPADLEQYRRAAYRSKIASRNHFAAFLTNQAGGRRVALFKQSNQEFPSPEELAARLEKK